MAVLGIVTYGALELAQRNFLAQSAHPVARFFAAIPAPIALILFCGAAIVGAILRIRRARLVDVQRGLATLRDMPWKDFELLVAEIYSRQGYAVDYALETGPDGGVDVTMKKNGRKTLVQCKCWKKWVGVAVVREMFGVMHHESADEVFIVTTGTFTEDAVNFAKGKPIRLIDGRTLWLMVKEVQKNGENVTESMAVEEIPACPKCGGAMSLKLSTKGSTEGQNFWSCHFFPKCRGNRSV